MKFTYFIRALQSAEQKDLSYSIKNINLANSHPHANSINKNLSCIFVTTYKFGDAEIILSQGVSINYHSSDGAVFHRKELLRVDYLDNVLLSGINNIQDGRFDLVFLFDQLEGGENSDLVYDKVQNMVDVMFTKVHINDKNIAELLTKAFDNYILAMPDVRKLFTQDSKSTLIEELVSLKMSDIASFLQKAESNIDGLKLERTTSMHKFISGYVTASFDIGDSSFTATYYMERKYPIHVHDNKSPYINYTSFENVKKMKIEGKTGELILDLANMKQSVESLHGNSALFYKLQSVFGLIKRGNSLECVTNVFDEFYFTIKHGKSIVGKDVPENRNLIKQKVVLEPITEEDVIIDLVSHSQNTSTHTVEEKPKIKQLESPLAPRLDHMFWRPFYYKYPR